MVLRYLNAYRFKIPETFEGLKSYYEWREKELPVTLNPNLIACLVTDDQNLLEQRIYSSFWKR